MVDTSVSKNIVSLTHAACCVEVQALARVATAQLEQHLTTPEDLAFRFLQQWCIQFFDESPAAEWSVSSTFTLWLGGRKHGGRPASIISGSLATLVNLRQVVEVYESSCCRDNITAHKYRKVQLDDGTFQYGTLNNLT